MIGIAIDLGLEGFAGHARLNPDAPVLQVRPDLVGQGAIGAVLSVTPGQWSGAPAPDLSVTWWRDGQLVPGESALTYEVRPLDAGAVIYACITAQNNAGAVQACSPLLPIWPNQSVPAWQTVRSSPGVITLQRAPGPPDLPDASGGTGIVLT